MSKKARLVPLGTPIDDVDRDQNLSSEPKTKEQLIEEKRKNKRDRQKSFQAMQLGMKNPPRIKPGE